MRNGTATVSPMNEIQNDHIYLGIENDLVLSQVYTTSFTCMFGMQGYPFDTQKCSMIFILEVRLVIFSCNSLKVHSVSFQQGNSGKFAELVKGNLEYLGPVDLREYFIKSYTVTDEDDELLDSTHGNKGVRVNFIFSRRLLNQLLTVFMPTMCIVIVSFCASFFRVIITRDL